MGSNLDPRVTNPKKRYEADRVKGGAHRQYRSRESLEKYMKNAGELFGESPNLRKKAGYSDLSFNVYVLTVIALCVVLFWFVIWAGATQSVGALQKKKNEPNWSFIIESAGDSTNTTSRQIGFKDDGTVVWREKK